MRITVILLIACCCSLFSEVYGQRLASLADNTITVNTRNSPLGNRDVIEVTLPAKTQSCIYRISIFKKDQATTPVSLYALLDSMGAKNVSLTSDYRQFAVSNSDKTIASVFIFSNPSDADHFYLKEDNQWRPCKNLQRITSSCFLSRQCLGKKIYFGFSNGDVIEEIDVRLEVVGLIE